MHQPGSYRLENLDLATAGPLQHHRSRGTGAGERGFTIVFLRRVQRRELKRRKGIAGPPAACETIAFDAVNACESTCLPRQEEERMNTRELVAIGFPAGPCVERAKQVLQPARATKQNMRAVVEDLKRLAVEPA